MGCARCLGDVIAKAIASRSIATEGASLRAAFIVTSLSSSYVCETCRADSRFPSDGATVIDSPTSFAAVARANKTGGSVYKRGRGAEAGWREKEKKTSQRRAARSVAVRRICTCVVCAVGLLADWITQQHDLLEKNGEHVRGGCSGMQEPPATPVARDELALRRHRFFSELLQVAQNTEHRVRFDPLGPRVHTG